MNEDFSGKQYRHQPLDIFQMHADPHEEFSKWYKLAIAAKEVEPNAMCLTTSDADAQPHARMVLMKGLNAKGLTFFTNYKSQKAVDIEHNPNVAVVFWWAKLHRQVRITGKAIKLSSVESAVYFASRPRSSQINALASPQTRPINSRDWLLQRTTETEAAYQGKEIPCPDDWGGYQISIGTCEFWQGLEYRLHDRILYFQEDNKWHKQRLAP